MKAYINAKVFNGREFLENKIVLTDGKVIVGVIDEEDVSDLEVIDCAGDILAPGLVDLQIYGGGGRLFASDLTAESLHYIADSLAKKGTTGFLITVPTNSTEVFKKAIDIVKENPHPAVLGINIEGPYISSIKKGAHQEQFIRQPSMEELKELFDFSGGVVKMITLAPEMIHDDEVYDFLVRNKAVISVGHSNATFDEANVAFDKGAKAATHLFNAMSPMHHRDVGIPGAVFNSTTVSASIIPDGIHVSYEAIRIAHRLMGDRLFYITDAIEETHSGPYIYILKGDHYELPDGTLAGSALTMPLAVKNGTEKAGIPLEMSLSMATILPAQLIKAPKVGRLRSGYKANMVCLTNDLKLKFTVLEGQKIDAES